MIREGRKLPPDVLEKLPEAVRSLSANRDIVALYLFGSAALNALKSLSDLDFGILFSLELDKRRRFDRELEIRRVLTEALGTDEIDVVVMNASPPRFSHNIFKEGKLLFCNNPHQLVDFRDQTTMQYLDFRYLRHRYDGVFLEGIGYGGREH